MQRIPIIQKNENKNLLNEQCSFFWNIQPLYIKQHDLNVCWKCHVSRKIGLDLVVYGAVFFFEELIKWGGDRSTR